jgi:hypothetical protein
MNYVGIGLCTKRYMRVCSTQTSRGRELGVARIERGTHWLRLAQFARPHLARPGEGRDRGLLELGARYYEVLEESCRK